MFLGRFKKNLDDKGRFTLPAPFRDTLLKRTGGLTVFMTRGLDDCLFGFDPQQFQRIVDSFDAGAFAKEAFRKFEREFYGNCVEAECDQMGRLRIPKELQEVGGLKKKLVLVGASNRFEIWDADLWEERHASDRKKYEKMAEGLF